MRSLICVLILTCVSWLCFAQATPKKILIVGDSLSTAYGINQNEGWVSLLAQRLASQSPDFMVVNESISGQTTAAGLAQLPVWLNAHQPQILILELGGNDGLQGLPIAHIEKNLKDMVVLAQKDKINILLLGMQIPTNYGPQYTEQFKNIYPKLAAQYHLTLVPFFLEGVGGYVQYIQYDGIHPGQEAQDKMLNNVWPHLEPSLK